MVPSVLLCIDDVLQDLSAVQHVQALTLAALAAAGVVDVYEHRHTTNKVGATLRPGMHPLRNLQDAASCFSIPCCLHWASV